MRLLIHCAHFVLDDPRHDATDICARLPCLSDHWICCAAADGATLSFKLERAKVVHRKSLELMRHLLTQMCISHFLIC